MRLIHEKGVCALTILTFLFCTTACINSPNNVALSATTKQGNSLSTTTETEVTQANPTDFSDFGFENMHQMNTWIEVLKYNFEQPEKAYILVEGDYATLTFKSNVLQQQRWNRSGDNPHVFYDENGLNLGGYPWNTTGYSVIDNYHIVFTYGIRGNASLAITDINLSKSIPLITCKFKTSYLSNNISDGYFIPSGFIDWQRSPEESTYTATLWDKTEYERDCVKYYVLSDKLH